MDIAGVKTQDYQLAYRLIQALRTTGIRPVQLSPDDPVPASLPIWFGTPSEVESVRDPRGIGCTIENLDAAITAAILGTPESINHIVFGVDPGPRPGLAWVSRTRLLGSMQLESVDETVNMIDSILADLRPIGHTVKIGDGSKTISCRLVNVCLARGHIVEVVDERRTSMGSRHSHAASAARIAQKKGKQVVKKIQLDPSEGEIKEIQRRSRSTSGGRVTIPKSLAKAVAVGRMDIHEAVQRHGNLGEFKHVS